MLPMQMRAGVEYPHPHALYQLLLDASDGVIDHHAIESGDEATHHLHANSGAARASSDIRNPDLPTYSDQIEVSGSLAVLALLAALPTIPPTLAASIWPQRLEWRDRIPVLESPPPRIAGL
jgi:hypothetical protein